MMRMYCMHTWRLGNLYTCHRYRSFRSSLEDFGVPLLPLHSVDYVTDASPSLSRWYKYLKITSVVGIDTSRVPDHALYSTPWDDHVRYESMKRSPSTSGYRCWIFSKLDTFLPEARGLTPT